MVLCIQNSDFSIRIACLYVSQPSSVVFEFKSATLAPELQVSTGPSPHLWFLNAKQRRLNQNYKSLWVPDLTCRFVHAKQCVWIRIASLCGSQTSPVVVCRQNSIISTRITSHHGSQTSPVVLCRQNSVISTRITSHHGSQTSPVVLCRQNSVISTRITSHHGSQTSPVVLCMQNNVISIRITSLYGSQHSSVAFAC